jgi:phosphotransferase system  glucose/maltose/N-acetylglucosamine-specific IIC component
MAKNEAGRIRVVTGIESVAFFIGAGVWITLANHGQPVLGAVLGYLTWTLITDLEHFVAQNLGFGNPLFQGYPFKLLRPGP